MTELTGKLITKSKKNHKTSQKRIFWLRGFLMTPAGLFMVGLYGYAMLFFLLYSFNNFEGGMIIPGWSLDSWKKFFTDTFYLEVIINTLRLALIVTISSIAVGYPVAYYLNKLQNQKLKQWLAVLVFAPLLVSVVVRSYGWLMLLASKGVINNFLLSIGLISEPLRLVYNFTGVVIATVHVLLPFACFPIFSVLTQLDPSLKEAGSDLGASRMQIFWKITFPISIPGVIASATLVFPLALSAFITPTLLGGGRVLVLSQQVYQTTLNLNWPMGAILGVVLILITMSGLMLFEWMTRRIFGSRQQG